MPHIDDLMNACLQGFHEESTVNPGHCVWCHMSMNAEVPGRKQTEMGDEADAERGGAFEDYGEAPRIPLILPSDSIASIIWGLSRFIELKLRGDYARLRVVWADRKGQRHYRLEIRRGDNTIERPIYPLPLDSKQVMEESEEISKEVLEAERPEAVAWRTPQQKFVADELARLLTPESIYRTGALFLSYARPGEERKEGEPSTRVALGVVNGAALREETFECRQDLVYLVAALRQVANEMEAMLTRKSSPAL